MTNWLKHSLIARGGLAMASIALIALLNIFASVIVADKTRGDAAAINVAGSLRMQAYKLGYLLQQPPKQTSRETLQQQVEILNDRLHSHDSGHLLSDSSASPLSKRYANLTSRWDTHIKPAFYDSRLQRSALRTVYDRHVHDFVAAIDSLVKQLQQDSESKIRLLLTIQGASMLLVVLVLVASIYNLNTSIVVPLRRLVRAASTIRGGNLQVAIRHDRDDELGQLADTFNQMAVELSRMYTDLERKVTEKTAALSRSNQSLQLMYSASRTLAVTSSSRSDLGNIIEALLATTGVKSVAVCLGENTPPSRFHPLLCAGDGRKNRCEHSTCDECYLQAVHQADSGVHLTDSAFPLRETHAGYGILFVEAQPGVPLSQWQIDLFNAISDTIATALSLEKKSENETRLMLAEERAAIARELHDSLAQSLSCLKFQIGRWKMLQARSATATQLNPVVDEIADGINQAYRQLRELLTTFRLTMHEPGLEPALKGTVAEFSQRGNIDIRLDYGLGHVQLTPNAEVHLLQIIRESLSNIVKHAQAKHADITLTAGANNQVQVSIDDDGIGLPATLHRQHHFGLTIMKERATQLNAELHMMRSPMGGVRVMLDFQLHNTRDHTPARPQMVKHG